MTYGIGIGNSFCTKTLAMFEFRSWVMEQRTTSSGFKTEPGQLVLFGWNANSSDRIMELNQMAY